MAYGTYDLSEVAEYNKSHSLSHSYRNWYYFYQYYCQCLVC